MGLGAAVTLDVIIAAGMCYYLQRSKSGLSTWASLLSRPFHSSPFTYDHYYRMNELLDTLVLYTVETGAMTWCGSLFLAAIHIAEDLSTV